LRKKARKTLFQAVLKKKSGKTYFQAPFLVQIIVRIRSNPTPFLKKQVKDNEQSAFIERRARMQKRAFRVCFEVFDLFCFNSLKKKREKVIKQSSVQLTFSSKRQSNHK
jgi:hypothetical protein